VPVLRRRRWWPRWAVAGVSVLWLAALSGAVAAAFIAAKQFSYLFNPLIVVFAIVIAAALALGAGLIRSSHPMAQETHV
jgi:predicted lysophospholipase L1 biosynthesis ABC-type transport system permease subunit